MDHPTAPAVLRRLSFQQILYALPCWLALALAVTALSSAQDDQNTPVITPRSGAAKKKDQGPRALGLLQLSATGKATLIPIVIRIDGKFYDASAYKADPIPMSLDSGIVYEAERSGNSLGLFTVNGALHSDTAGAPHPWLGTGTYLPAGTEAPKTGIKAESVPVGIEPVDGPPRLSKSGKPPKPDAGPAPPAPNSGDKPQTGSPSKDSPKADEGKQPDSPAGQDEKSAKKTSDKKDAPPTSESSSSFGSDATRPRLRRGKPTEPLPSDDDIPGYSRPGSSGGNKSSANSSSATAKAPVQLIPAISDAGGPDPRSYEFQWDKAEEDKRRTQMLDLAKQLVAAYAADRAKSKIEATPAKPTVRRQKTKPPQPELENVQLRAFDLWTNNQPILVLTADAHLPLPTAGVVDSTPYTVTLVARTDIYSNLHPLYSGVTDQYHLDVTPRLDLIDVVDVDGDGRGELLFEETSDAGKGYVIYRATIDKLWKMFDTLNQE